MDAEWLQRMNRVVACLHNIFILWSMNEMFSYGQSMNLVLNKGGYFTHIVLLLSKLYSKARFTYSSLVQILMHLF